MKVEKQKKNLWDSVKIFFNRQNIHNQLFIALLRNFYRMTLDLCIYLGSCICNSVTSVEQLNLAESSGE